MCFSTLVSTPYYATSQLFFSGYGDGDSCALNPDDLMTPIQKLEKYSDSDNVFNRYKLIYY